MTATNNQLLAHLKHPDPVVLKTDTLIGMLELGAQADHPVLTILDRQGNESNRTFADLLEGARGTAAFLKNRGLVPGDKVVMMLLTSEHFVNCFFGTILAGGIPVAVSPPVALGDIEKYLTSLGHIIQNSRARFMIGFPRVRKLIGSALAGDNQLETFISSKEIRPEKARVSHVPSIDPDSPAFFQYTSGSTGLPKGAMLSHRALLSNVAGISHGIDLQPGEVTVSWLPLFHDMGLIGSLFSGMYCGGRIYAMSPEAFIMRPASWLEAITRYRATIATAPNFAYHLLASRVTDEELRGLDLSSLKVAINGAEPIDLRTLEKFEKRFSPAGYADNVSFPVYGMAENCLAATFPRLHSRVEVEPLERRRLEVDRIAVPASGDEKFPYQAVSVGGPIQGQEIAILGEGDDLVMEGQVGEILVRGPSLMLGYHRNPEGTDAVLRNGWLHTGDLGFISSGRLFVTGRAKEMVIKRGRNYYPYDIERAASSVSGVRKGCLVAFSTPNEDSGTEDLILVAETREADTGKQEALSRVIAAEVLAAVGIRPDKTLLVPPRTLPKTSSGKPQRLLARRRYLDGTLVKGRAARLIGPVKTLVGSFLGNRKFKNKRS